MLCAGVALFAAAANVSYAQTARVTLIEEATNASCGPCAAQNPTFQAYLMQPGCGQQDTFGIHLTAKY